MLGCSTSVYCRPPASRIYRTTPDWPNGNSMANARRQEQLIAPLSCTVGTGTSSTNFPVCQTLQVLRKAHCAPFFSFAALRVLVLDCPATYRPAGAAAERSARKRDDRTGSSAPVARTEGNQIGRQQAAWLWARLSVALNVVRGFFWLRVRIAWQPAAVQLPPRIPSSANKVACSSSRSLFSLRSLTPYARTHEKCWTKRTGCERQRQLHRKD